jgi:hypothetical protein
MPPAQASEKFLLLLYTPFQVTLFVALSRDEAIGRLVVEPNLRLRIQSVKRGLGKDLFSS